MPPFRLSESEAESLEDEELESELRRKGSISSLGSKALVIPTWPCSEGWYWTDALMVGSDLSACNERECTREVTTVSIALRGNEFRCGA